LGCSRLGGFEKRGERERGTRNFGDAGCSGGRGWLRRSLYEERDCDGTVIKKVGERIAVNFDRFPFFP
jgi:hypothetical protein